MIMQTAGQIWLVTGVSGGLGLSIALAAAKAGHSVYGTLRRSDQLADFENLVPGLTHAVLLDVNDHASVEREVKAIELREGRIDVLVNNAGYGLFGAVEETSMEEARAQMETNFFGLLAMTQAVIPGMRARHSGAIVQISSVAGFRGTNGLSIYNASKFAVEGFSEALAQEMQPLGIKVMCVEPGPFRTNWAGSSSVRTARRMDEYAETAGARIAQIEAYSGQQPGDPDRAADVILRALNDPQTPLHLPLGPWAIEGFRVKMQQLSAEIDRWEKYAADTGFAATPHGG
jgi:NAD(P)-dependent dehydrogenase (short-subunit alcohol dehydrogenase family)